MKKSVILMRERDKERMQEDCDAEKRRSRDHDYAIGRIAFDRIMPLINEKAE